MCSICWPWKDGPHTYSFYFFCFINHRGFILIRRSLLLVAACQSVCRRENLPGTAQATGKQPQRPRISSAGLGHKRWLDEKSDWQSHPKHARSARRRGLPVPALSSRPVLCIAVAICLSSLLVSSFSSLLPRFSLLLRPHKSHPPAPSLHKSDFASGSTHPCTSGRPCRSARMASQDTTRD